jgi:hypothetical protein
MRLFGALITCILLSHSAYAEKPKGAPVSSPAERKFFVEAVDEHGLSCCSESDGYREGIVYPEKLNAAYPHPGGVILREWMSDKDVPGGYRVNIAGAWQNVPPNLVVKSPPNPPNVTGGAVVWATFTFNSHLGNDGNWTMTNEINSITIRCFSPGNQF